MRNQSANKSRNEPAATAHSKTSIYLFRLGLRVLFILCFILLLVLARNSLYRVFYSDNPQFIVKKVAVKIVKGNFSEDHIIKKLNFSLGKVNLFAISPGELRQEFLRDPLIQEIEIRRILPHTLSLTVYGRTPVAQLIKSGERLVDALGIIMAPANKSEWLTLPVITGIARINSYKTGEKLNDPMLLGALQLLAYKEMLTNSFCLNIDLIQLNANAKEYRIYLHERKECFIRDRAILIVPYEGYREALERAMAIIHERMKAQLPIGSIDVTYRNRVPVLP